MEIRLYNNTSDEKIVNKSISLVATLQGELKEETSLISPSIRLNLNDVNFNYIYIPEFGRYYYVNEIRNIRKNLWEIDCHVDVLMSFKGQFKGLRAMIERTENDSNYEKDYDSNDYISKLDNFIEISEFSGGFNDNPEFILLTAGAVSE